MAYFKVTKKQSGGSQDPIYINDIERVIEDHWDYVGETTYTFDEDIDECLIVITYTREQAITDTRYTLTLASGTYRVLEDSGIVVGQTTQDRMVYIEAKNVKIGDTLYIYNYGDLRTADVCKLSQSARIATGSFTSGTTQYQKVEVNCGFKPDLVIVDMEFGNGYSRATYVSTSAFESTDHPTSVWDLRPVENVIYAITPGSEQGETGITDITSTGFKYRVNGGNTQNKACTYKAIKF